MKKAYQKTKEIFFTLERESERYTYSLLTLWNGDAPVYGISVNLSVGEEEYENETAGLFSSREGAIRFLALLGEQLVTPCNLPYVIEDILSDFD